MDKKRKFDDIREDAADERGVVLAGEMIQLDLRIKKPEVWANQRAEKRGEWWTLEEHKAAVRQQFIETRQVYYRVEFDGPILRPVVFGHHKPFFEFCSVLETAQPEIKFKKKSYITEAERANLFDSENLDVLLPINDTGDHYIDLIQKHGRKFPFKGSMHELLDEIYALGSPSWITALQMHYLEQLRGVFDT